MSQPDPTQPACLKPEAHGGELTNHTKLIDPMTMEDSSVPFLNNAEAAVQSAVRKHKIKPLSLLPLVALIFYDVSGGPFGIEVVLSCVHGTELDAAPHKPTTRFQHCVLGPDICRWHCSWNSTASFDLLLQCSSQPSPLCRMLSVPVVLFLQSLVS